jgi:DNA polymerase I-like protein with 3'-5' exonuclease and polymerase domains
MTRPVAEIWHADSEWGFRDGRIDLETSFEAVVFCLVGRFSQERHSFWAGDPGLKSFMETHRTDLFVAHNVVAEMKYLLRANIRLPERWYDTYVAWRLLNNRPGNLEAGLISALDQLGVPHMPPLHKKDMQDLILNLRFDPDKPGDRAAITSYCLKDCDDCGLLYERIADRVDAAVMRSHVEYLKAVARMELRGVPVDTETARKIMNSRSEIVEFLVGKVNAVAQVYQGLSFNRKAFLRWASTGGISWPWRLSKATGRPIQSLDDDAMKLMELRHPFISLVRQVRKTIGALGRRSIRIDGRTNRHYFSTWPFRSITGRNQPRNYIYGCPKWMRYLIVPETPDHRLIYLDAVSEEIGIAAALSGDPAMRRMYETDDAHMTFAIMANAAPAGATKKTHKAIRKLYKAVSLGVLYGQTEYGIADRLGIDTDEARVLLEQHKELFPEYWNWSRSSVESAFRRGEIRTRCGWSCIVPADSKYRTWMNWPIQATGGDMMRLVVTYLDQQNVRILAPVHDGFLLSCKRDQLDDLQTAVKIACELACDQVLNYRLKWELEVFKGRYRDEDGEALWNLIGEALGALYRGS